MSLTSYRAAPPRVNRLMDVVVFYWRIGGPGGDLLFHALRRSTIGAEGFHGRVRDGIGCFAPRYGHQAVQAFRGSGPGGRCQEVPETCFRRLIEASCACVPACACPGGTLVPPPEKASAALAFGEAVASPAAS